MIEYFMKIKMSDKDNLKIIGKNETVLISRQAKVWEKPVSKKSRILLVNSNDEDMDLSTWLVEDRVVIRGVGDYEVGGVAITGYAVDGGLLQVMELDDLKVGCLNNWVNKISEKTIEKVSDLDVLLLRLLSEKSDNKKEMVDTAKKWGVNYLVLMSEKDGSEEVVDFLDKLDREDLKAVDEFSVDSSNLPDGMEVVLLSK